MLKLVKSDLKGTLFNRKFIFLIVVASFSLFWCAYSYCYQYYNFNYNAPDIIGASGRQSVRQSVALSLNYFWVWFNSLAYFSMFIPIIACTTFSDSFIIDLKNSRLKYLYIRLHNKNKYIVGKIISAFIIGVLSIMIPLIIGYIITLLLGNTNTQVPLLENKILGVFGSDTPSLFITTYIVIQSLLGGGFCILGLGFSTLIKNKITPILFPFICYLINILFTEFFKLRFMSFQRLVNCYSNRSMNMVNALLLILGVCVIGALLFYLGISRKEYEQ